MIVINVLNITRERVGYNIGGRYVDEQRNTASGVVTFIGSINIKWYLTFTLINNYSILIILSNFQVDECSKLCLRQGCHTFAYRWALMCPY